MFKYIFVCKDWTLILNNNQNPPLDFGGLTNPIVYRELPEKVLELDMTQVLTLPPISFVILGELLNLSV